MLALLLNLVGALWLPWAWLRRGRAAPRDGWVRVSVGGAVRALPDSWFGRFFAGSAASHATLAELAELAVVLRTDPRVAGVLVTLEPLAGGMASAWALRRALVALRASGKRVVVWLPDGGRSLECYVASAADRIWLAPDADLAPIGFAVSSPYFGSLLAQLGVEAEAFTRGRYKSAAEALVADHMSEAQREQLEALLDGFYEELVTALADGRGVARRLAEQWIDDGPWAAQTAVTQGLVDALVAEPDLVTRVAPDSAVEPTAARWFVGLRRYLAARRGPRFREVFRRRRVAVVALHGPIGARLGAGPFIDADAVITRLERLRTDRSVAAVVLEVRSPGGSAEASARLERAVRRLNEKKPVVAYLSDVAASGGYFLAVGAPHIVASPFTVTGSIGVVAVRPVLEGLLARAGINVETVRRGAHAEFMRPHRRSSAGERAAYDRLLDSIYGVFLGAVARGRKLPVSAVEAVAGGRVWLGRAAAKHGLVDELGGLEEAIEVARTRAKLSSAAPVALEPEHAGFALQRWLHLAAGAGGQARLGWAALPPELAAVVGALGGAGPSLLAWWPHRVE